MNLGEVAADLYGRTPAEFVAARNEQVRAAKESGAEKLAADIAALRKPTVAAWTVNMLVRTAPDEVAALLRLGVDLRTAQRELSGKQLRLLTAQRRHVVDALAARAGTVAAEHGQPVTAAVLRQVGETLTAALADPEVAERVRTATLASAANYAGFGPVGSGLSIVRADEGTAGSREKPRGRKTSAKHAEAKRSDDDEQRRVAREAAELRAAEQQARRALEAAEHDARLAAEELRRGEERLAELRTELAAAEEEHRFARQAERATRYEVRSAATALERARRRLE
ncbi:hypothetical protein HGA13_04895 [Nocardia speluncae]|uniref:Uncharacterized protein n=1 Tax=Nocardia speluncae TaxID=419477 RepID=A0A846XCQ4_9NOCA|nr:hypothetical protein [Nocardia speluncae]NKY32413.1 hypothetical protein [Nocardia speluncae]